MARPGTIVNISNGNLGRLNLNQDGTTLLAVSAVAATGIVLGTVMGPFKSLADAEAAGITAAYDTANQLTVHSDIKAFYSASNFTTGVELYVLPLAKTVTLAQMVDFQLTHVATALQQLAGKIKLVVINRTPASGYTATYTDGLDNDIISAITKAKELANYEFNQKRPIRIIIAARDIQTPYSSLKNLRAADGPNANRVMLVAFQDKAVASAHADYAKYAAAAYVAGKLAGNPVQRNIGRVKDGPIDIAEPRLSNGVDINTLTDVHLDTLHDKGYVIAVSHINRAGYYISDDPMAAPLTDDYSQMADGRVIDKATRITHDVFTEELNDDVLLDTSGKLPATTIKTLQGRIEGAISAQMRGEISSVSAYIDPSQVVATTSEIETELDIFKVGYARSLKTTIGFKINQ